MVAHPQDAHQTSLPPRQEVTSESVVGWTDSYFTRTRQIIEANGDTEVTYAVFMRRPVVSAPRLSINWLEAVASQQGQTLTIELTHPEGYWVGAGVPIIYITGSFRLLVELETVLLQKLGPACVAAYNASVMCMDLPKTEFLAMDARHCAGKDMAELMAYAASVGSNRAKRKNGAIGFIGNATNATAHYFGQSAGFGTMPHALIGYAGSTIKACELFHQTHPEAPLTALVDYFGKEISDALAVAKHFPELAHHGKLAIRLDTPGSRFAEGLDPNLSYEVLNRHVPSATRGYLNESELHHLIGPGVSAASIWNLRAALDEAGFPNVRIVGSSGFGPAKCKVMALAKVPLDVIGTGSYLPEIWSETYATADIISYGGTPRVKVSREFLLRPSQP